MGTGCLSYGFYGRVTVWRRLETDLYVSQQLTKLPANDRIAVDGPKKLLVTVRAYPQPNRCNASETAVEPDLSGAVPMLSMMHFSLTHRRFVRTPPRRATGYLAVVLASLGVLASPSTQAQSFTSVTG